MPPVRTNYKTITTSTQQYLSVKHSPLEDEPWKRDDSYWDALQVASKDPEAFEKFIEESMGRKAGTVSNNGMHDTTVNGVLEEGAPKKKKGKYVPIEQWDAERSNPENMSAEERLQWECQRGGNQFRQNEILLHNLKSF